MSDSQGVLLRGFAGERTVRLLAVDATVAAEACRQAHGLGGSAARLAAEGAVASVLMSAQIKGDERISLQIQASAPRFSFMGEVDADGNLRARLTPSDVRHEAGEGIEGMMLAVKADADRELYRGHTLIQSSSIEAALTDHLGTSSQVDAILRIAVELGESGEIRRALGLLVERMPEHLEFPWITRKEFEQRYALLQSAPAPETFTLLAFGKLVGSDVEVLESRSVRWQCRCSLEKVENTLLSLGEEEMVSLIDEGKGADVTCHFCNHTYTVAGERLEAMLAECRVD